MSTSTTISVVVPLGPGGGDPRALAEILHAALSPSGWSCELVAIGVASLVASSSDAVVDVAVPVRLVPGPSPWDPGAAVIAGIAAASGDHVVVLDAVAHVGEQTLDLLGPLLDDRHDFVLGSRHADGGAGPPGGPFCRLLFRLAALLAQLLTPVRDPRSGCFAYRREGMPEVGRLRPIGAAIGLEVLVRGSFARVGEVSIAGAAPEIGAHACREFARYLQHLRRLHGHRYPIRCEFVQFGLVGASGFVVDVVLYLGFLSCGLQHLAARALSFWGSATSNWALNRWLTFSGRRRTKKRAQWPAFMLSSLFGFILNWGTYYALTIYVPYFDDGFTRILAMMIGVIVGMGLNFVLARMFVFVPVTADDEGAERDGAGRLPLSQARQSEGVAAAETAPRAPS